MYTTTTYLASLLGLLGLLALPLLTLSAPQAVQVKLFGAYYCTGTHWTGGCAWTEAIKGNCVNIDDPSGTSFSFGPDKSLVCKVYTEANCQMGGTVLGGIVYPGYEDVSELAQGKGLSIVRSWNCKSE